MSYDWKEEYMPAIIKAYEEGHSLRRIAEALTKAKKPITGAGINKWIKEYEEAHGTIKRERKLPKL